MTKNDRLNFLKKVFNIKKLKCDNTAIKEYSFKLNNSKISFGFGLAETNENIIYVTGSAINKMLHKLKNKKEIISRINEGGVLIIEFVEDFKNIDI